MMMKSMWRFSREPFDLSNGAILRAVVIAIGAAGLVIAAARPTIAQNESKSGAGAYFDAEAGAKDVGLPIYPGARPQKDTEKDSPSVKMGMWGGSFAFKLAVAKFETNDPPAKVASFYKKALAKYGPVLDCTKAAAASDTKENADSTKLECGDDKPDEGGMLFKSGTKEKQHIAGIKPNGTGTNFQIVYVQLPHSQDQDK
jgi:hypothetical protein